MTSPTARATISPPLHSWFASLRERFRAALAALARLVRRPHVVPPPPDAPTPPPPIVGVSTDLTAFVGTTASGPVGVPSLVLSVSDYQQIFGASLDLLALDIPLSLYFRNGGRRALVLRIAAPDGSSPNPGTPAFADALFPDNQAGGINALRTAADWSLLVVPGETRPEVLARLGAFAYDHAAFLIADAPSNATASSLAAGLDPALAEIPGSDAALYAPWLRIPGPEDASSIRMVPPSGAVAGVFVRTDSERGIMAAPAGTAASVLGVIGPAVEFSDHDSDTLNPLGINLIRRFPGRGILIWGSRTVDSMSGEPERRYVPVRRLGRFLERSIVQGTRWAVLEPNDAALWSRLRLAVEEFLTRVWRDGALQGSTASQAFFVRCDASTNTPVDIAAGNLTIEIGFAPLRPAEFVIVRVRQSVAG